MDLLRHLNYEKPLEKYKAVWTKIEDVKNIELNALPVYNDRSIKTKIRTYGNEVYTNYRVINMLEDGAECESFRFIYIDSLLVSYTKTNATYKNIWTIVLIQIANQQMTDIILTTISLEIRFYKFCITIELKLVKELNLLKV